MKIIIAPDSFKGSLSAMEAAEAIASGVKAVVSDAECVLVPLADGGEGTAEALVKATGGHVVHAEATDPLGKRIQSFFGILGDRETAVVEMAAASGLALVPEELRNPMLTTTFGTGELIKTALDAGCRRLILGIGGSATNDGGVGAMQALGASFRDDDGCEVGLGGKELSRIRSVDVTGMHPQIRQTEIVVACDVDNPLTGEHGAAAVFAPQKGATPEMVSMLDAGLHNLAEVIRRDLGVDVESISGAGAAGGLGAACIAFLRARLRPGIEIVLEATRFSDQLDDASLVITGEGRIDSQTLRGKTISGVLKAARAKCVPVLALGGGIEEDGYEILEHGAVAVLPIVNKPMELKEAQSRAFELLARAAEQAVRLLCGPPMLGV